MYSLGKALSDGINVDLVTLTLTIRSKDMVFEGLPLDFDPVLPHDPVECFTNISYFLCCLFLYVLCRIKDKSINSEFRQKKFRLLSQSFF